MSSLNCPQCGFGPITVECSQCRYSSAVFAAGPNAGHRAMDPFWWVKIGAVLPLLFLILSVVVLAIPASAFQPKPPTPPTKDDPVAKAKDKDKDKTKDASQETIQTRPGPPGTLVLQIKCPTAGAAKNLEIFIDGKLAREFKHAFELEESVWMLSPGEHEIQLKKNGVEVFKDKAQVKKPDDGKSFFKIDLVVTGTVRVVSRFPIGVGVEAYVSVDDAGAKPWKVGLTEIEITAEVGPRVVRVYTKKPEDKVHLKKDVPIEPGKTVTLSLD